MRQNGSDSLLDLISASCYIYKNNPRWPFSDDGLYAVTFINHYSLLKGNSNGIEFGRFDFIFIDGLALAKQLSLMLRKKIPRVSFDLSSCAYSWMNEAAARGCRIIIIGGSKDDSAGFRNWFYKNIKITNNNATQPAFYYGYSDDINDYALRSCSQENFNFVVLGLGTPHQEMKALELKALLCKNDMKGVILTCGGFITQTASSDLPSGEFYPFWINKINIRWLYRCIKQPYVLRRVIYSYPISYINVIFKNFR